MAGTSATHETLSRQQEVRRGSDRSFGIVFAVVFGIVGAWPLVQGTGPRWWALAVAGGLLACALVAPRLLAPLNRLWFVFGEGLHRVMTPLVMGVLFFGVVAPVGLLMRATGKDPLRLRFDPQATSYWIPRAPPGPAPDSLTHQF